MKRNIRKIYLDFLENGTFFDRFPTLTGFWHTDVDKFIELYEKFVEETTIIEEIPKLHPVVRDKYGLVVCKPSESLLKTLKATNNKNKIIEIHIQKILLDLELYNLECQKGFEISIQDLVNNIKSRSKSIN